MSGTYLQCICPGELNTKTLNTNVSIYEGRHTIQRQWDRALLESDGIGPRRNTTQTCIAHKSIQKVKRERE